MTLILSTSERASFSGVSKIIKVQGPLTLFRLCGKTATGDANNPFGRFWFNEKFFWNMLDVLTDSAHNEAQLNHYLRFLLREFTAVCHDWNSFASIYQFSLPAREPLELAVGRIAAQPFFSSADPNHRISLPHEVLVGGEFQYIVDFASNPSLRRYVQGPRPLLVRRGIRV
jgi:hypothetical protein